MARQCKICKDDIDADLERSDTCYTCANRAYKEALARRKNTKPQNTCVQGKRDHAPHDSAKSLSVSASD